MEVLHDLRSRRRTSARSIAALLIGGLLACGGGDDRAGLTADSAAIQSRSPTDTGAPDSVAAVDSATTDSIGSDSVTFALPTLVLVADSAEGDVLYRRKGKCLSCHGVAGKGLEGLGASLQDSVWLHGDGSIGFIDRTIVEGIARPKVAPIAMPAMGSTLTPVETYRIAAYVYTLSHPNVTVADTTRLPPYIPPVDTGAMTIPPPPTNPIPPASAVPRSH
jgi:mono/diheme cytochrome c family protein